MRLRRPDVPAFTTSSNHAAAAFLATGLMLAFVLPASAQARGLTTKPDEKRVVRVARLTPPSYSYIDANHSSWNAFNLAGDRVILWQYRPVTQNEWGYLSDLTSWTSVAGFEAAKHLIPVSPDPPTHGITPRWSELPGENDILYGFNRSTGYVLRVDLTAGTSVNWVHLDLDPDSTWGAEFELPGFSTDLKFIVWRDIDKTWSDIYEVDVVGRTVVRHVPSPPEIWSADWKRYPYAGPSGHFSRSPDATKILRNGPAPDLAGYQLYLQREGQPTLGLGVAPMDNHSCWRYTNNYAVFGELAGGNIYQIWTDGTLVKLLDVRLSDCPVTDTTFACYYHNSSYPNLNRGNSGILYTSDDGDRNNNIGVYYAFLADANAGNPVGITSFTANPAVTLSGKQVNLNWSTVNATSVAILPKPNLMTNGAAVVKPTKTTTYTLTAQGSQGPVTKSVTVQVSTITNSLIINGSMESATNNIPSNWSTSTSIVRTTEAFHDFLYSCATIAAIPTDQAKVIQSLTPTNVTAAQGHRVKLSAWLKSSIPTGHTGVFLNIGYGSPPTVVYRFLNMMVPPTWTYVDMATTLPSNVSGFVYVTVSGANGNQYTKVYIDQVVLQVEDTVPLPVIQSFAANPGSIPAGNAVALTWTVSGAASASIDGGVGAVDAGAGTVVLGGGLPAPTSTRTYTLTTNNGVAGGTITRPVTVNVTAGPTGAPATEASNGALADARVELRLETPAPNPGHGPTVFRFALPRPGRVSLTIHDVQGREIRRLANGPFPGGDQVVRWDGRDSGGHAVATGLYFARLEWGGQRIVARLARLR